MRKKNILWCILAIIMVAVFSASFVACSDDDDDGNSGGGKTSKSILVLDKSTGLRVQSVGDYRYYYDDNGLIDYIRSSYARWEFTYSPNKIVFYSRSTADDEEYTYTVGYNSAGYLSSLSFSVSETLEDVNVSFSGQASLLYDNSGHLTKISANSKETGYGDGERYSESETTTYTYTWQNNLLVQEVWSCKWSEDDESGIEKETTTYSYDNSSYQNVYRQWTPSIASFDEGIIGMLAYVGLLGVGPDELPSSDEWVEEETENGKTYTKTNSHTYSYGFNSNGTVSYCSRNGSRTNFTYSSDAKSRATRSVEQAVTDEGTLSAQRLKSLFRSRNYRKQPKQ